MFKNLVDMINKNIILIVLLLAIIAFFLGVPGFLVVTEKLMNRKEE